MFPSDQEEGGRIETTLSGQQPRYPFARRAKRAHAEGEGDCSKPELAVRRLVHSLGYRYRLHNKILPGKPDLVFGSKKKVIFVHGCYWHRHPGCARTRLPKSPETREFWREKLEGNAARDKRKQRELESMGWSYLVIWECEAFDVDSVTATVTEFLDPSVVSEDTPRGAR